LPARATPDLSPSSRLPGAAPFLAAIDALDTGVRSGPDPDSITLESYGVEIPEV
jgi:hypothetical protein